MYNDCMNDDKHAGPVTLRRVTVNLTPRSDKALGLASLLGRDSLTDTRINRALHRVYAYFMQVTSRRRRDTHFRRRDGKTGKILLSNAATFCRLSWLSPGERHGPRTREPASSLRCALPDPRRDDLREERLRVRREGAPRTPASPRWSAPPGAFPVHVGHELPRVQPTPAPRHVDRRWRVLRAGPQRRAVPGGIPTGVQCLPAAPAGTPAPLRASNVICDSSGFGLPRRMGRTSPRSRPGDVIGLHAIRQRLPECLDLPHLIGPTCAPMSRHVLKMFARVCARSRLQQRIRIEPDDAVRGQDPEERRFQLGPATGASPR